MDRGTYFPNFIEEKSPSVGQFKSSLFAGNGPGERPPLVPEELGFQQRLGEGRAAHFNERFIDPGLISWTAWAITSFPVPLSP